MLSDGSLFFSQIRSQYGVILQIKNVLNICEIFRKSVNAAKCDKSVKESVRLVVGGVSAAVSAVVAAC